MLCWSRRTIFFSLDLVENQFSGLFFGQQFHHIVTENLKESRREGKRERKNALRNKFIPAKQRYTVYTLQTVVVAVVWCNQELTTHMDGRMWRAWFTRHFVCSHKCTQYSDWHAVNAVPCNMPCDDFYADIGRQTGMETATQHTHSHTHSHVKNEERQKAKAYTKLIKNAFCSSCIL